MITLLTPQRGTPPDTDNSTSQWKSTPQKLLSPSVQGSVAAAGKEKLQESCQEQEKLWTSFQKQCRIVPAVLSLHLPLLLSPPCQATHSREATGRVNNPSQTSPGLSGNPVIPDAPGKPVNLAECRKDCAPICSSLKAVCPWAVTDHLCIPIFSSADGDDTIPQGCSGDEVGDRRGLGGQQCTVMVAVNTSAGGLEAVSKWIATVASKDL